jgi:hypothetical protein
MIILVVCLDRARFEVGARFGEHSTQEVEVLSCQHPTPMLGHEDQMNMKRENTIPTAPVVFE